MNLEKWEKLASLAEKYDYKPDESHFNNLAAFVGINSSLIADLCKEYTTLQRGITNAQEALKSAGIEADTVQAGVMEMVSRMNQVVTEMSAMAESRNRLGEFILEEIDADYPLNMELETPATDAYLNAVRAEGLDMAADEVDRWIGCDLLAREIRQKSSQLRAGNAGKDGSHE